MFHIRQLSVAVALWAGFGGAGHAAAITEIGPVEFTSTNIIDNTLSGTFNSDPRYTFSSNASIVPANSNQLPRTGTAFVGAFPPGDLRVGINFSDSVDFFEVGGYFGNDDFFRVGPVTFFLEAFDRGGNLLGAASVAGNGNDSIDQFLGLRSDTVLGSAVFYSRRTTFPAGDRPVALDDFRFGFEPASSAVPVPATAALLLGGLAGLGLLGAGRRSR